MMPALRSDLVLVNVNVRHWTAAPLVGVVLALAIALFTSSADARPERDRRKAAKAEVQKAELQYKLGRFDDALAAYTRAYELFNAPALLFNIGQCHKNLKNYDRAIFFFEGYLREETKAEPRKRQLAQELIAEARAQREQLAMAAAAAERAKMPPPPPLAPPPPPQVPILVDAPAGDAPAHTSLVRKGWFWTAVGAGAILVAGGALAYYFSGPTTTVPPGGTVGTLDRR